MVWDKPVTIRGDDVVDTKLLADLLNAKMQGIRFQLLVSEVGHDHGRQAHEAGGLVLLSVSPAVALLAPFHAVCRWISWIMLASPSQKMHLFSGIIELTSSRASATADAILRRSLGWRRRRACALVIAAEAPFPQRNVVGTCYSLVAPRHDGLVSVGDMVVISCCE